MSEQPNAGQIEVWNEVSGPKWVEMQEMLDTQMAPFMQALIEFTGAKPGDCILDIGCGCGDSTLNFARVVGAEGRVDGVDVSKPMLDHARGRAESGGVSQVSFRQGDAQVEPLSAGAYDHVVSRFGVMFFENPAEAFANIRSALKPGGSFSFICWRPIFENTWMTIPAAAAAPFLEMPALPEPNSPGPFQLADETFTRAQLEVGGFTDIVMEKFDLKTRVGTGGTPESTADFATKIGPVSGLLKNADKETFDKAFAAMVEALREHEGEDGVKLDFAAWLVRAKNQSA